MAKFCSCLLVFALVCSVGTGIAFAKGGKGGKNKKGKQSVEERLKAFDKDNDGKLSKAEFADLKQAEAKQKADKAFAMADTNHDGFLSPDEIKATVRTKGGKKKGK